MTRAIPELSYDPEHDTYLDRITVIELGPEYTFEVAAGTAAGRREPNSEPHQNEDAFSVVGYGATIEAAVYDGASSQRPIPELHDTTGARFASHELKRMHEAWPHCDFDLRSTICGLNLALGARLQAFESVNAHDANSLPTSTATMARLDAASGTLGIAHVSDSFAIASFMDGSTKLITNNLHRPYDEQILDLIKYIADSKNITPREARKDSVVKSALMDMFQSTRNRPDGSGEGVVNGDPNMERYVYTRSLALSGIRALLLGSDGLVPPGMDERDPKNRAQLFRIAEDTGISGLLSYLKSAQDVDPDRKHARYKHADDATGVYFKRIIA